MKKIYTSYYAKSATNPLAFGTSCRYHAHLADIPKLPMLAPKWEFVLDQIKGTITWEQYIDRYMDLIVNVRKLDAHQVVDVLPDGAILMCYERSDEMQECHRRLLADWIHSETGIYVPELDYNDTEQQIIELVEW